MKNRIKNNKGFTLIELVMVIVILGILAAVAIPRFVDLQGSARTSVANGIGGALAGQITMLHANKLINKNATYDAAIVTASIDASGFTLTGLSGVITAVLDDATNYTWTYNTNGGALTTGAGKFQAATVDGPTCNNC